MSILKKILNQTGAMFGMDARVALIIASVLAATGGVTVMSKIERNRVEASERGVAIIRDAIISYYETIDLDAMPPNIATLFASNVVEEGILEVDPWGNQWEYNVISDTTKNIDDVPVTIFYIVIHSRGKDTANSSVTISSLADYTAWVPQGDDIGIKFNTLETEKKRVNIYRDMGKTVVNALNLYEASKYLEADAICSVGGSNPTDTICTSGLQNYTQYNYYLRSSLDTGSTNYYSAITAGPASFTSGDVSDMQALLTEINIPTTYATDPWGKILNYSSNATSRTEAPFSASVWYE